VAFGQELRDLDGRLCAQKREPMARFEHVSTSGEPTGAVYARPKEPEGRVDVAAVGEGAVAVDGAAADPGAIIAVLTCGIIWKSVWKMPIGV
jgi:hypothetical protein